MEISKTQGVSVLIITRNRATSLRECLLSILPQLYSTDEICVIDNNSRDNTGEVITRYQKKIGKRLKYFFVPAVGIALARNKGLSFASNRWVAFIDDDCVAEKNWLDQIHTAISQNPNATAVIGPNKMYDSSNIFSRATAFFYDFWLSQSVQSEVIYNPEILDAKNMILNKSFLHKNNLAFDESLELGEDCDMGIQIEKAKGIILFNRKMVVRHKHPTTMRSFLVKQISYSVSAVHLLTKWHPRRTRLLNKGSMIVFFMKHKFFPPHDVSEFFVLSAVIYIAAFNKIFFFLCRFTLLKMLLLITTQPIVDNYTNSYRKKFTGFRRYIREMQKNVMVLFSRDGNVLCPICGWKGMAFLDYKCSFMHVYKNAVCPGCLSHPRHRVVYLFLKKNLQSKRPVHILHFAPERSLERLFLSFPNVTYTSCDVIRGAAQRVENIESLSFKNNSFDFILCLDVLEHVNDDKKAMKELYRVLAPGGLCVLDIPIEYKNSKTLEDPMIRTPQERERRYWQEDHVRLYGKDFPTKLRRAGFRVRAIQPASLFPQALISRHGLPSVPIYEAIKP